MEFTWINTDNETLSLEGHPLVIKLRPADKVERFVVVAEGHVRGNYNTLAFAKTEAQTIATEIAEFRTAGPLPTL